MGLHMGCTGEGNQATCIGVKKKKKKKDKIGTAKATIEAKDSRLVGRVEFRTVCARMIERSFRSVKQV